MILAVYPIATTPFSTFQTQQYKLANWYNAGVNVAKWQTVATDELDTKRVSTDKD